MVKIEELNAFLHDPYCMSQKSCGASLKYCSVFVARFRRDALELLDFFGLGKAYLVGVSMCGGISQLMAIEYPGRVSSLTLISSSLVGAYGGEPDIPTMSPELGQKFASSLPSD